MQNPHFGSKIKISKKDVKIYPTNHLQLFCAKNCSKIAKLIIFNQKLKMQKNKGKTILQQHCSWSVQKTAPKNTKYSTNESILKIGHHAKAIAHAKSWLWLKNYMSKSSLAKNMSKSSLQIIYSCSVQKTAQKKHQIFEKWEHFENRPSCKGYSPCKIITLAQKLQFQKTCQNPFYKSFTVVLCKKPLQKTPNIPEMRAFWKSAIMQRL